MDADINSENGPAHLRFISESVVHRDAINDPLYPDNNWWRIPPRREESNEELRKRLKNCVHFFSLFFKEVHFKQSKDINYAGFPTCFRWYNGGLGLEVRDDLDERWVRCFYNDAQARKAYDMLGVIISAHVLKWPEHPTSWVKQLYEVLDQLEERI